MTSQEIITIISAAIAALAVAIVQVITALKTNAKVETLKASTEFRADIADMNAEERKVNAESAASRSEAKLDVIHEQTNSNLSTVKADLALANDRIAKLEQLLTMGGDR